MTTCSKCGCELDDMIGYCTGCIARWEEARGDGRVLAECILKTMTAGQILDAMDSISRRLHKGQTCERCEGSGVERDAMTGELLSGGEACRDCGGTGFINKPAK